MCEEYREDDSRMKPCPFCGSLPRLKYEFNFSGHGKREWYIECYNCNAWQGRYDTAEKAIAAWNMRECE